METKLKFIFNKETDGIDCIIYKNNDEELNSSFEILEQETLTDLILSERELLDLKSKVNKILEKINIIKNI